MSENKTFRTLIGLLGLGALAYVSYRLGQDSKSPNSILSRLNNFSPSTEEKQPEQKIMTEEEQIVELITEIKNKPYKTKKDYNNIELLQIKLEQLKSNKKW